MVAVGLWYGQAYVMDNEHRCILLMAFWMHRDTVTMLQHDNARPHVARICTQFLEAENFPVLSPVSIKVSYSSGYQHTATMILSSIVVSDFCLGSLRRNHVTTRARALLDWLTRIFTKVQIFQLARFTRYARRMPETINSQRVICANRTVGCLSHLCIDLTCK